VAAAAPPPLEVLPSGALSLWKANLTCLPIDAIKCILSFLPVVDIINLSATCRDLSTRVSVERVKSITGPYRYPMLVIEHLPHFPCLRALDLTKASLGPLGATRLAEKLPDLHLLKDLRLGKNYIGLEGIQALSTAFLSLKMKAELTCLHLSDNEIGRDGAEPFARALHHSGALQSLETLDLSGNNIGLKGATLLFSAFAALGE